MERGLKMSDTAYRKYTKYSVIYNILNKREIVICGYDRWDDKNDVNILDFYKRQKNLKSLFIYCLANDQETYHHWNTFSRTKINDKNDKLEEGVCIKFDSINLDELFKNYDFRRRTCRYCDRDRIDTYKKINLGDLPIFKRFSFKGEKEIRFIYENKNISKEKFTISNINISSLIDKIIFNPWIDDDCFDKKKKELIKCFSSLNRENENWGDIITKSELLNDDVWQKKLIKKNLFTNSMF